MGTILASIIVNKAQIQIQDRTGVRWPLDELLGWVNSGQRQIVLVRPDACSETVSHQLQAGSRQRLPAGAIRLLDVIRNQGTDDTPGRVITICQRAILDSQLPGWHYLNPANVVKHFVYDEREPATWYCFPPQPTQEIGKALLLVSKTPTPCTIKDVMNEDGETKGTETTAIALDDVYETSLIDYVIFRAQMKDAEFAVSERANLAWTMFLQGLGLKSASDKAFAAMNNAPPRSNPNVTNPAGAFGA